MTHTQKGKTGTNSTRNEDKSTYFNKNNQGKKRKTSHYCLYHGSNTTHNSDDCKVLKAQAERMSSAHGNKGGGKYNRHGTDYDKKKASNQAFQSFATDVVEKVIKKMRSLSKKNSKNASEQYNMKQFNYEDFRELSVSSSDNSSTTDNESKE